MAMTTLLQNQLLNATLGNVSYTTPPVVYVGLSTIAVTAAGNITEPVGNGYSRQSVVVSTASGGSVENTATVTFTCTGNAWPTVLSAVITDAASGGNVMYFSEIPPRLVEPGNSLIFETGDVRIAIG